MSKFDFVLGGHLMLSSRMRGGGLSSFSFLRLLEPHQSGDPMKVVDLMNYARSQTWHRDDAVSVSTRAQITEDHRATHPTRKIGWLRFVGCIFLPFSFGYFLAYYMRNINATLAPIIVDELSLGASSLGILTGTLFWSNAFALIPVGIAVDRYGPGRVQLVLLTIASAGMLLHSLADTVLTLTAARFLVGIGFTNSLGAGMSAIALWGPPRQTAFLNGAFLSLGTFGAIAATSPTELLLTEVDWRTLFLVLALFTALAAVMALLQPSIPIGQSRSFRSHGEGSCRSILRDPWFRRFAPLSGLIIGTSYALQGLWVSNWFADVAHLTRHDAMANLTIMAMCLSASALIMGLVTQHARRRGIGYGALLSSFGLALLTVEVMLAADVGRALAPWCVIASLGGCVVIGMSANAEHFDRAVLGRANAILSIFHMMSAFLVQSGVGFFLSLFEPLARGAHSPAAYAWMFTGLSALQLAATLRYVAGARRQKISQLVAPRMARRFADQPASMLAAGIVMAAASISTSLAYAHSWYPHECCSGQDCGPAERIEPLPDGRMRVHAGGIWADTPRGFSALPSQDSAVHACIIVDENGERQVRCLFLPPGS